MGVVILIDFYILQGTVWEGRVGDRHLIVRSNGQTPTLDIIDYRKARVAYSGKSFTSGKVSGQPIDRIIYTLD